MQEQPLDKPVQAQPTPFSLRVTDLPDGYIAVQVFLVTGLTVLIISIEEFKQLAAYLYNEANKPRSTLIVPTPSEAQVQQIFNDIIKPNGERDG